MEQLSWLPVPGIRVAAVKAEIKKPNRRDLVVFELASGARTAGVFTLNRFCAAPVQVTKKHLASKSPKYLMINTGYANAGTGELGMQDCLQSCELLAQVAQCSADEVLPFSTGVIGQRFPLAAFERGLPDAIQSLDEHGWGKASEGIMTTDTRPKITSRRVEIDGEAITITGISKGAGMIKPNMATMLGFIATDAKISQSLLEKWSSELANVSFNRITIDGDTSTNDCCVLVATGCGGHAEFDTETAEALVLKHALEQVYVELAQAIVRDGEGATKFVEVRVDQALTHDDARIVAETVAHSPLVKTALFASDPNWGRILAAVGRAPIAELDVNQVNIWIGDVQIVSRGGVANSYTEEQGANVMAASDIAIRIELGAGDASETVWTCDFSYDYVKINAEYRT
ncbi:MAG: bifunctional glutamate N-acetyltransferase/amino-acid acetyltransferase ArgJ [Alcanivoracaceae bacterium]|nr:bifunctional glutamate N-acetyltransferase/amino-acid acetyltransferase ArgJ [Alcanivoracaceae bacterium]